MLVSLHILISLLSQQHPVCISVFEDSCWAFGWTALLYVTYCASQFTSWLLCKGPI